MCRVLVTLSLIHLASCSPGSTVPREEAAAFVEPEITGAEETLELPDIADVAEVETVDIREAETVDVCIPDCGDRECGDDGCGGECGPCADGHVCLADFTCLCVPDCADKDCGSDGCGDSCGECGEAEVCELGECVPGECHPMCTGKECGPDGCEGLCGKCDPGFECVAGACQCSPECEGKECGDDGCGAFCGDCPPLHDCTPDGLCLCLQQCDGKICGDDGCGGNCGLCPGPQDACLEGLCFCQPYCEGKECGSDGCEGSCGICENVQESCQGGLCVCLPYCTGKECGPDGCGGECGDCDDGKWCTQDDCLLGACYSLPAEEGCYIMNQCYEEGETNPLNACGTCEPDKSLNSWVSMLNGTPCGPNGECMSGICQCVHTKCQGECCNEGELCTAEGCCQPDCTGKECGSDGCGGSCGPGGAGQVCDDGLFCTVDTCEDGLCVHSPDGESCLIDGICRSPGDVMPGQPCLVCIPGSTLVGWTGKDDGQVCAPGHHCYQGVCCNHASHCFFKECGDDACGFNCGQCQTGNYCQDNTCKCTPVCIGMDCGDDGCGGSCGNCQLGTQCNMGQCKPGLCTADCLGKECGGDGCSGSCGWCEDNLSCTKDFCAGTACEFVIGHTYCVIDGECQSAGAFKPGNECLQCQPALSQGEWTPVQDGLPCGVGKTCQLGNCE